MYEAERSSTTCVVDPVRGLQFIPASDWIVYGEARILRGGIVEPKRSGYQAVVNGRTSGRALPISFTRADPRRPWRGLGPLQWASATGSLMGHIESALRDEASRAAWDPSFRCQKARKLKPGSSRPLLLERRAGASRNHERAGTVIVLSRHNEIGESNGSARILRRH